MRIVASLFPNGELRVRRQNRPPSKVRSDRSDRPLAYKSEFQDGKYEVRSAVAGLSEVVRPGWGMTPRFSRFGIKAKRTLRRVGGEISKNVGRRVAMTFTLPGSTPEALHAMADYSGYIANRVKTWIFDKLSKNGKPDWFYVWELQERGALHLHFCVQCDFIADYHCLKEEGKAFWVRVMKSVQERSGARMALSHRGIDWFDKVEKIQYYCQIVRSGVGNYFSKYLGKDSGKTGRHVLNGLRPSRWWGCSRSLLQRMRRNTVHIISEEMSEGQSLDAFVAVHEACVGSSDVLYTRRNDWNKDEEIICFGRGVFCLVESLERMLLTNSSYRREAMLPKRSSEREAAFSYFRVAWRKNEGRLELASLLGTNNAYWFSLCQWMTGVSPGSLVPIEEIKVHLDEIRQAQRDSSRGSPPAGGQLDIFG